MSDETYQRVVGVFGMRFPAGHVKSGGKPKDQREEDSSEQDSKGYFDDFDFIHEKLSQITESATGRTKFIAGGSYGVERLAEQWCREYSMPFERVRPHINNVEDHPFSVRNSIIFSKVSDVVVFWDGVERGLEVVIRQALILGKNVSIYAVKAA